MAVSKDSSEPGNRETVQGLAMSAQHGRRHGRLLSPKKVPPLVKPLPPSSPCPPRLPAGTSVESVPSTERKALSSTECSESSCPTPPPSCDCDHPVLRATPTPEATAAPSMLLPKIIEGFPGRAPRALSKNPLLKLLRTDPRYTPAPPIFHFNDFLWSQNGGGAPQSLEGLKKVVLSRCNYHKLVGLFLAELHSGQQTEVCKQIMSCEAVPEVKSRVPHRQIICELAALIHMEVEAQLMRRRSCLEEATSRSEQTSVEVWVPGDQQAVHKHHNLYQGTKMILNSVTTKLFHGSRRTTSPFQHSGEYEAISPSELAILDCLTLGAKALSLKAHFIAVLPDLSPLAHSLVYLNLSFNELSVFPVEVFELSLLEELKMRDNPIQEIPSGIHRLLRLKTFIISFCRITSLPSELYQLPSLRYLDVSFNLLSSLTNDIQNLRTLEYLNLEGNQLAGLPRGALRLSVTRLNMANNYMQPMFTKSFRRNSPQKLVDSATRALRLRPGLHSHSLPPEARLSLSRVSVCDCCLGPLYGPGLTLIRPCYNIFKQHKVPFIFRACSPNCHSNFRNQTESLLTLLYGEDAN